MEKECHISGKEMFVGVMLDVFPNQSGKTKEVSFIKILELRKRP